MKTSNIEKYFIDLIKLSDEQQKHIFSLLPEPEVKQQYIIVCDFKYLHYDDDFEWWVDKEFCISGKTELTYPDFIKLFEGGEGENELEVWLNRQIEKCQELDMPREEWAFIQVLKKINSNQ